MLSIEIGGQMPEDTENNWRKKPRGERVTLIQVKTIIDNFKNQDVPNPSVRQIRTALGERGSLGTISKFKEQLLSSLSNKDNILDNRTVIKSENNVTSLGNILGNTLENDLGNAVITTLVDMQKRLDGAIATIEVLDEQCECLREKWHNSVEGYQQREKELLTQVEQEKNRADTTTEHLNLLEKENSEQMVEIKRIQEELLESKGRFTEREAAEESDYTEKGQRIFKNELAFAVHYLVMTAGISQKEVAALLGLSNSDVSKLKNTGTKLHQKKQ